MTEPFDEKKSYLSIKAHEGMIAFVSFLIKVEGDRDPKEGILKIASSKKPYGGGYLTLTFMVDTADDPSFKDRLERHFERLKESALYEHIGGNLEGINKVSLDTVAKIEDLHIEEINVHLRTCRGGEKTEVEQSLLPAIEKVLPCKFQPVEWWPLDKVKRAASSEGDWVDQVSSGSIKALFRKWFGS